MLKPEIVNLLNEQINKELYSSYLYLDMANYYEDENLDGFANWFMIQAQEERDHAMLIRQYLLDNGEKVKLLAIAQPDKVFTDYKTPLVEAYEHEKFVTASINNIYDVAYSNKDFLTMHFLDWFVKEQLEEESNADTNIKKYELFAGDSKGLYLLNSEFQTRVYTPTTIAE